MNAVVRVSYKLPSDFPDIIGDLIQKLVVCSFEMKFLERFFILYCSVLIQVNDLVVMKPVE
jgi:hypothetical protein